MKDKIAPRPWILEAGDICDVSKMEEGTLLLVIADATDEPVAYCYDTQIQREIVAAVNSHDAHCELARITRIVLESTVGKLADDHRAYLSAALRAVEEAQQASR